MAFSQKTPHGERLNGSRQEITSSVPAPIFGGKQGGLSGESCADLSLKKSQILAGISTPVRISSDLGRQRQ